MKRKKAIAVMLLYMFVITLLPVEFLTKVVKAETTTNSGVEFNENMIWAIEAGNGYSWFETLYGFYKISRNGKELVLDYSSYNYLSAIGTKEDSVYLVEENTLGYDLLKSNATTKDISRINLPITDKYIISQTLDTAGYAWFGLIGANATGEYDYYLMRINPDNVSNYTMTRIPQDMNYIFGMQPDVNNNIWFIDAWSTTDIQNRKIARAYFDASKNAIVTQSFSVDPSIGFSIDYQADKNGDFWINDGESRTIKRYKITSDSKLQLDTQITDSFATSLTSDNDGNMWIASLTEPLGSAPAALMKYENGSFVKKYDLNMLVPAFSVYNDYNIMAIEYVDFKSYKVFNGGAAEVVSAISSKVDAAIATKQISVIDGTYSLLSELFDATVKAELTAKLDAAKAAINLEAAINTATAAVVKAEASLLQADVDAASALVNALTDETAKAELLSRLSIVQQKINSINTATAAVVKAEASLLQADVDAAKLLVDQLFEGTVKTSLLNRIAAVQSAIDLQKAVKAATDAVVRAEASLVQADKDAALVLVNALPAGTVKTDLVNRVNAVQALIDAQTAAEQLARAIEAAGNAVTKAEQSQLQADVDAARNLVNSLPAGTEKTQFTSRLDIVQDAINVRVAEELARAIQAATDAVVKAEASLLQADKDAASILVNALPEGTAKADLTARLAAVQKTIIENRATAAVVKAEGSLLQADVDAAKVLVDALSEGTVKTDLTARLAVVQKTIVENRATAAVVKAEGSLLQADVDAAKALVEALAAGTVKADLTVRLSGVQTTIDVNKATDAVVKAEATLVQADADAAKILVSSLPNGDVKTALTNRLNAVQEKIDILIAEAIAKAIKAATDAVVKAEESELQADVDEAKRLVNLLQDGQLKNELTTRLSEVQKKIDAAKEAERIANLNKELEEKPEGSTTNIDYREHPILDNSTFDAIKGQDKNIVLEDGIVTWTFNGKDITQEIKDIDLRVNIAKASETTSTAKEAILETVKDGNVIVVSFAENGVLPGAAKVKVNLGSGWANKEDVYVYYFNPTTNKTEKIAGPLKADASGNVEFTITHNSDYIVADRDLEAVETQVQTETQAQGGSLVQTGSPVDLTVLYTLGGLALLGGALLVFTKKKQY
jgi:LPXTG-motif cell wall-anchored protein